VLTLRCTKRLLDRLGASRRPGSPAIAAMPTTRLGDWHAKVLYRTDLELVLLASDRSLLPVLVPASPRDLIVTRFVETLGAVLARLEVPADRISAELAEMGEVHVSPTRSRQVLGSMNDFDRMLDSYRRPGRTLVDIALELAEAPCGPIAMQSPKDVAAELLGAAE
jgi:hypothetical protein